MPEEHKERALYILNDQKNKKGGSPGKRVGIFLPDYIPKQLSLLEMKDKGEEEIAAAKAHGRRIQDFNIKRIRNYNYGKGVQQRILAI